MSSGLTTDALRFGLGRIAEKMDACAAELNETDGKLGDGDLGVTLAAGTARIRDSLDELPDDVGMALFRCAQVMTSVRGSSYGTLLATGLMSAAKKCKGKLEVPWNTVSELLGAAVEKMAERGKSELGQKTVLDAVDAARQATAGLDDPQRMLRAADLAVAEALATFQQLPNKQGRARMFGERSIGLHDPGMLAFKRMLEGLEEA